MDKPLNQKTEVKSEQIFDMGGVEREREKIVEMVRQIYNEDYIISIYSFVKVFFDD